MSLLTQIISQWMVQSREFRCDCAPCVVLRNRGKYSRRRCLSTSTVASTKAQSPAQAYILSSAAIKQAPCCPCIRRMRRKKCGGELLRFPVRMKPVLIVAALGHDCSPFYKLPSFVVLLALSNSTQRVRSRWWTVKESDDIEVPSTYRTRR